MSVSCLWVLSPLSIFLKHCQIVTTQVIKSGKYHKPLLLSSLEKGREEVFRFRALLENETLLLPTFCERREQKKLRPK
jgi:hypothetical protein